MYAVTFIVEGDFYFRELLLLYFNGAYYIKIAKIFPFYHGFIESPKAINCCSLTFEPFRVH